MGIHLPLLFFWVTRFVAEGLGALQAAVAAGHQPQEEGADITITIISSSSYLHRN